MTRLPSTVDIVVVGAGAAGLAAARAAIDEGLTVIVLEAKDRIGGRAWTRQMMPGLSVDMGARWLHSADENPLSEFGRKHGFDISPRRLQREIFLTDLHRWADAAERDERETFFDECERIIAEAAASGRDVPIDSVLPDHPRWRPMFEHWVTLYTAVSAADASTADYSDYRDTGENWTIREGYGALVAAYGAGLPVATDAAVVAIDWGRRPARVTTTRGSVEASAVIVTVSTGVLADESIRFDPPLPGSKRDAIGALPLGRANWIAVAFDRNVFGADDERFVALWAPTARTIGFTIRRSRSDLALGFVGGPLSTELERAGAAAMTDFALQGLAAAFGHDIARHVAVTMSSAWEGDRHVRGSYSAARPGFAHFRSALAAPLDGVLFFAGEATSPEFYTTVHGAYLSGARAVQEIVAKGNAGAGRNMR